ncbi:MAG: endonuclease/exonuclease/phosphatase family protein [Treponema sp.]|nr:endonuclease/exonuclease/phosphatase family protein [Treponema sp.]
MSCENANLSFNSNDVISVVSWNTQTFFDGVMDGCEYSDFQKPGNWNNEKYQERLKRLCSVITELDADIYVFEEIENQGIIYDISNQLAGKNWGHKNSWQYSCFTKPEDSSIGCGIISRFKIKNPTTHGLDIRIQKTEQPSMRHLLQVTIEIGDRELVLFANHWKSKSGGQEKTEIWRDWQESVLAGRLYELNDGESTEGVILCGDFNRDAEEFIHCNNETRLRNAGFGNMRTTTINSSWNLNICENSTDEGSYYYQNHWEKIDHIFTSAEIQVISFFPCVSPAWTTSEGFPFSYSIYTGNGFSDHLPVKALIKLE